MTTVTRSRSPAPGRRSERKTGTSAFTLVELLVVIALIVIVVALFLPTIRSSPRAAKRLHCRQNLRQIALALQNYEAEYQCLPPAYTTDASGKPLHSWRTLILPYLEQTALYATIDLSKPWDDPANLQAYETKIDVFCCPSVSVPANHTTYLAVVAPGSCFQSIEPRKLSDITDDRDLTLMVVEVDAEHSIHWMAPADIDEQWLQTVADRTDLPQHNGVHAAMAGGKTIFLQSGVSAEVLRAMISIAGDDDAIVKGVY